MENITIFEVWEIKYRGEEIPKFFDWWAWEAAQKFANEVDVESIRFHADGMTDTVNGRAYERPLYEETLSSEELAGVSRNWIEERRTRLKRQYSQQN